MIRLSNEAIDNFKRSYVSSDQIGTAFLIILALYKEDYALLDKLDNNNEDKRIILLYRDLVYKGYLVENEDNEDSSNVHFSLTEKSIELIESLDGDIITIEKEKEFVEPKEKVVYVIKENDDFSNVEDWIRDWIELWPTRANGHSYPLRTGKGVCANKMRLFIKQNPEITKQDIFDATKLYLEDQQRTGLQYTQQAGNFISKAESGRGTIRNSTLATYCELLSTRPVKSSEYSELEDNNPFL